jgi:hypothetical protein
LHDFGSHLPLIGTVCGNFRQRQYNILIQVFEQHDVNKVTGKARRAWDVLPSFENCFVTSCEEEHGIESAIFGGSDHFSYVQHKNVNCAHRAKREVSESPHILRFPSAAYGLETVLAKRQPTIGSYEVL